MVATSTLMEALDADRCPERDIEEGEGQNDCDDRFDALDADRYLERGIAGTRSVEAWESKSRNTRRRKARGEISFSLLYNRGKGTRNPSALKRHHSIQPPDESERYRSYHEEVAG